MSATRQRARFVLLAVFTIALGLWVHRSTVVLNDDVRDIAGDALWAMMMAWWIGALAPRAHLVVRSAIAYAICVGVEFSQLLHTPQLDAIRATLIGRLVLGSGFDARDLASYAAGVAIAMMIERVTPGVTPCTSG